MRTSTNSDQHGDTETNPIQQRAFPVASWSKLIALCNGESLTREKIHTRILTFLGVRAAEFLFSGKEKGLTMDPSGGLEESIHFGRQMIRRHGCDSSIRRIGLTLAGVLRTFWHPRRLQERQLPGLRRILARLGK